MSIPFLISYRYQKGTTNQLISLIRLFSNIGIALGVAVLIIGLSAMNGFEKELHQRILSVVPHVEIKSDPQISPYLTSITPLETQLQLIPQVKSSAPFIDFTALIENGTKIKIAKIRGVSPTQQEQISTLYQFIPQPQWQTFKQHGGIILGVAIAKELAVNIGDEITLLLPKSNETNQISQPLRFSLPVSGILRLDGQLDHSYALLPIETARQLLNWPSQSATGIEISLHNPFDADKLDYTPLQFYPTPLYAQNWFYQFGYMYNDIQLIRTIMYIAMIVVISVACFNIVSTLIMAVKDKQSDIAILRTLGANTPFIQRIFLWYGIQSGMKGALIGILLGSLISLNLTEIIHGIETLFAIKFLSDGIYFVNFLPSELHFIDVIIVFFFTLIISLLASTYPAIRATKLEPAKILSGY